MSDCDLAERPELVALGRLVRAQGMRGQVRVLPFGAGVSLAQQTVGKRVFLRGPKTGGAVRTSTLEHVRFHRGMWIVTLPDCGTRDEAEALVGWELCLAEGELPALAADEYYDFQLVGLRVVDAKTGQSLGIVVNVTASSASDLLEVERENGERFLIPFVHALIRVVDLPAGEVRVDLPDGLVEVNRQTKALR